MSLVLDIGDGTSGSPVHLWFDVGSVEGLVFNVLTFQFISVTEELLLLFWGSVREHVDFVGGGVLFLVQSVDNGQVFLEEDRSELELLGGSVGLSVVGDVSHEFVVFFKEKVASESGRFWKRSS